MKRGCLTTISRWFVVYPLLAAAALSGLGFFGAAIGFIGAVLIYYSLGFRAWLMSQRGYLHRLARLPGLSSPVPATMAVAFLAYLLAFSAAGSLFIALALLAGFSDLWTLAILVGVGLLGLGLLYGWLIHGWGAPDVGSAGSRLHDTTVYFRRMKQLDRLKQLDPIAFEEFVGALFRRMGYDIQTTAVSGDEGIDLVLYKEGKNAIVQCKRYAGTVGQPVVRDLYGAMIHNRADEAYLVTTGTISLPAQQWTANKPVHLVDGTLLIEWVEALSQQRGMEALPGPVEPPGFSLQAGLNFFQQNVIVASVVMVSLVTPMFCCVSGLSLSRLLEPLRPDWSVPAVSLPDTTAILPEGIIATATPLPPPPPGPFHLALPQTISTEGGWSFTLERIEFLEVVESPSKRHRPEEGVFLVLSGSLSNFTDEDACLRSWEFTLASGASRYRMGRELTEAAAALYELDYPGFLLGQCLDYDDTEPTFLIFDVPRDAADLWLQFRDQALRLGPLEPLLENRN